MRPTASKRPWFQFSLRTLSLVMLAVGIGLGWHATRARRQQGLYQAIYRSNSSAYYDYQLEGEEYKPERTSWAPSWLHQTIGSDFLHPVVKVHLWDDIQSGRADPSQVDEFCHRLTAFPRLRSVCLEYGTDNRLEALGRSRHLQRLEIVNGSEITDRGIIALKNLTNLRFLDVSNSRVSKEGWRVLGGLSRLEILDAGGENLTDETVAHLAALKNLKELHVDHHACQVTDAGLRMLSELDDLEVLVLSGKSISDDGLSSLARLSQLRVLKLRLRGSHVTNRGLAQLATLSQLESLSLNGVEATEEGLMPLARLRGLAEVYVNGPNLQEGAELSKALPGCKVHVSNQSSSVAY